MEPPFEAKLRKSTAQVRHTEAEISSNVDTRNKPNKDHHSTSENPPKTKLPRPSSRTNIPTKKLEEESKTRNYRVKIGLGILVGVMVVLYYLYFINYGFKSDFQNILRTNPTHSFFSLVHEQELNPVTEEIIRKQLGQVNQRIDAIVNKELDRLSGILQHNFGYEIHVIKAELDQITKNFDSVLPSVHKLTDLTERINEISSKLPESQKELHSLQSQLRTLRTDLNNLSTLQSRLNTIKAQIEQQKENSRKFQEEQEKKRKTFEQNILSAVKDLVTQEQHRLEFGKHQNSLSSLETRLVELIGKRFDETQQYFSSFVTQPAMEEHLNELMKNLDLPLNFAQVQDIVKKQFHKELEAQPPRLTPAQVIDDQVDTIRNIVRKSLQIVETKLDNFEHTDEYKQLTERLRAEVMAHMYRIVYEDVLAKPDYALSAVGAKVVDYTGKWSIDRMVNVLSPFSGTPHPPSIMLESGKEAGKCWAFHGQEAFVTIRLAKPVFPESVSLDHISSTIALNPNLSSAPREFSVFGYTTLGTRPILLGNFEYIRSADQVQNFVVEESARETPISFVKVEFRSNYGHDYTCVYRVRVHGTPETKDNRFEI